MDDNLTKHLRSLSDDCTEMLNKLIADSQYMTNVRTPIFENGWLTSIKKDTGIDYHKIASAIRRDTHWTGMRSFRTAFEVLKHDVQLLNQTTCNRIMLFGDDEIIKQLSYFIVQFARERKADPHNAFYRSVEKFRLHLSSDISMSTYISPLYNVGGDFTEIVLSESLKIRLVTEDEHVRIIGAHESITDIEQHQRRLKYVLSCSFDCWQEHPLDDACKEYTFATNLIRLIKDGVPEFGRIYFTPSTNLDVLNMEMAEYYQSTPTSHSLVVLTTQDQENIVGLYKDLVDKNTKIKKSAFYTNAITRFGMAHRHRHSSNKIVDFVIALESLLGDSTGEATFKLAHRVSSLCGDSDDERLYLWEYMKETYRFRSGVVHSSKEREFKIGSRVIHMDDVANKLSEITATAILRIVRLLDQYTKQEDILDELDRCMYDRKKLGVLQNLFAKPHTWHVPQSRI